MEKERFAVAFIDVIMESDEAGLELADYIRKELHDDANATKCFERVLSTLMFVIDGGDDLSQACDGFLRNTSHLCCQQCTAAAA